MRKIILALICIIAFSCTSENTTNDALEILVTKTSVGVGESTTFVVVESGKDVTSESQIINTTAEETNLSGYTFFSDIAGEYTFKASFDGKTSYNEVVVTVSRDEVSPEHVSQFTRRNIVFKCTATWCTYCPDLSENIDIVMEDMEGEVYEIALHGDDALTSSAGEYYLTKHQVSGYPTYFIDESDKYRFDGKGSVNQIETFIEYCREDYPTVTGLKMSTAIDASNMLSVDVEATVEEENNYSLVVAILIDGYNLTQTGADASYTQDHVLHAVLQETDGGEELGVLAANEVVSKTYTYDFSAIETLPSGTSVKIISFILSYDSESESYIVNNAVCCPLGDYIDY